MNLTPDQQAAISAIKAFLKGKETCFVLGGYSGSGKSTTVKHLLEDLPKKDVYLTATTNKAASNLQSITGRHTQTIHKLLGLRVYTDYKEGTTRLIPHNGSQIIHDSIIFIDEASYIDTLLLKTILDRTENCKILFIGDPAQLSPVKSNHTPVFTASFPEVRLTEVVRQAEGNPIIDLSTNFRNVVNGEVLQSFTPDGITIRRLESANDAIEEVSSMNKIKSLIPMVDEITSSAKILAWTNKKVVSYNKEINSRVTGKSVWEVGDYGISNTPANDITNGEELCIASIKPDVQLGAGGYAVKFQNKKSSYFIPESFEVAKAYKKQWFKDQNITAMQTADQYWIDLRHSFAMTVNKSQGSTFKRVYVDLEDLGKCHVRSQLFRMLYVAASRASDELVLIGDLA